MSASRAGVLALLALSAAAIGVAPAVMPEGYSWVSHAISESAAQRQEGAWVARMGFLLYGFAVLRLTVLARGCWGVWGTFFLRAFAVMMLSTAAFSHRPWQPEVAFDRFEDVLHSITATGMGFAFAAGVVAVSIRRGPRWVPARALDFAAVAASAILPMGMAAEPRFAGALQRLLFLVSYVWYAVETARSVPFQSPIRSLTYPLLPPKGFSRHRVIRGLYECSRADEPSREKARPDGAKGREVDHGKFIQGFGDRPTGDSRPLRPLGLRGREDRL